MAHNGARAMAFLEDLKAKTERRFREENRELLEFRRSLEGPDAPELEPWDVAYYAEKQRAALYDFDEEALRPYFPLESVVAGLFDLVGRLYGIRVTEEAGVPAWDPAGALLQRPRRERRVPGRLLRRLVSARKQARRRLDGRAHHRRPRPAGGFQPHLGLICGNLTPPVGGKPALLTHREVETIFHEFGHLLHHLLSRVEIRSLAGTNVAWDFVELPSQIMENWCWERAGAGPVRAPLGDRRADSRRPVSEDEARAHLPRRQRADAPARLRLRRPAAAHAATRPTRDGDPVAYTRRVLQEFTPRAAAAAITP